MKRDEKFTSMEEQDEAWEDYLYWQSQDRKTRRINQLLQDISRNGYEGRSHYGNR